MTRTPASATEKVLHWSVAAAVLIMAGTGAVMYVPWLSQAVGQRFWVRAAHLAAALVFVLALLLVPALRWTEVRRLERDLSFWEVADWDWFRRPWEVFASRYQPAPAPLGRFNGGQKLLATLAATVLVLLLLTGVPMYWWGWFSGQLVARARDVHVLAALGLSALLAGHVYLALFSPYGLLQGRFGPQAGLPTDRSETR
jgi:formate dehydrogenase subunit gamma